MQSEDRQRANQIRLKITELSLFIYFFSLNRLMLCLQAYLSHLHVAKRYV